MNNVRKGYTQAITGLSTWKFLIFQIILFSITIGIYFESTYVFLAILFSLLALFYSQITSILLSFIFALLVALLIPIVISGINFSNLEELLGSLLSTPVSRVFALLVFLIAYYLNYSASIVIREALEPAINSVVNFLPSRKSKNKNNFKNKT